MATVKVPQKHKAIVYDKPGELSVQILEVNTPEPNAGEVLVKISHSGVCHSDLSLMLNSWEGAPPVKSGQIGGHEGVGNIVRFGPFCEGTDYKLGDRVGIKWLASACLSCRQCTSGAEVLCAKQQISGYTRPGTFQEFVVSPIHYLTPIPKDLDSAKAAPLLCGGLTTYSALRKTRAQPGDWVAISGAGGGLGHLATQIGKGMGFRMLGIDDISKESLVRQCGAEAFVDVGPLIAERVLNSTDGEGVAAVVVCSGNNAAYAQAMTLLRFNGVLVCVGVPGGHVAPISGAYPAAMVSKQLNIAGSTVGNRREAIETLGMASRGLVETYVTIISPESLGKSFEEMKAGKLQGRVVLNISAVTA